MVLNRSFLRTWRELSEGQRAEFQNSLKAHYPGKGRDLTKGVFDLTEAAQAWAKSEKDVGGPSFDQCIEDLARAYASDGRLILAVDTEFGSKEEAKVALRQMAGIFWKHQHKPTMLVRARLEDWLLVIEAFEKEFAKDGDAKFKLGYPPKFKKFLALFEDDQARRLRAWWQRQGRSDWAADLNSKSS
jgi:SAM-dependent methyltransferase